MAYYNGGFPATYQQIYPQGFQTPAIQQPQAGSSGVIWVQGEAAAKSYLVAPNTTVQLWDSETQVIYLKSADASGMPSMKILDYTIRGDVTPKASAAEYATKDELKALEEKIREIEMAGSKARSRKEEEDG